ncbi:uncharacterized protein [Clytia hemisphaerica]|uniref:uncharacterized protein n=1 Tax=Clytia hemisphaerica TaxID=252671 RepID=UPI0034D4A49D
MEVIASPPSRRASGVIPQSSPGDLFLFRDFMALIVSLSVGGSVFIGRSISAGAGSAAGVVDLLLRRALKYSFHSLRISSNFYEKLSSVTKTFKAREALIIGGDFNAKTRAVPNTYPNEIVGKYAKSDININGEKLIEFCMVYNLRITNTFFKHKPIHLTTWESPIHITNVMDSKTNSPRRNPYRNQIDYILVRNNVNTRTLDSKATISKVTKSDHKPVIAKIIVKWKYQQKSKNIVSKRFNVIYFNNTETITSYKYEIMTTIANENDQSADNQSMWDNIAKTLKQPATNTIGFVKKSKNPVNFEVQELSILQRNIQHRIQSFNTKQAKTFLKQFRNRILAEIHTIMNLEENEKVNRTTRELEYFHDNNKMYQAVKKIKNLKPPEKLLISSYQRRKRTNSRPKRTK